MKFSYSDILFLPHPTSKNHSRMPKMDRAAQFAPFAALTGYEAAIRETARHTDARREPDESVKARLDARWQVLLDHFSARPEISITYFVPDRKKSGGFYAEITGKIQKIDALHRSLTLLDGTQIPMDEIWNLESPIFCRSDF